GDRPPLRGGGSRLRPLAPRDVRARDLGRTAADTAARTRPAGEEAALLLAPRGHADVRLGAECAAGGPGDPARPRLHRARLLPGLWLRAGSAERLPRGAQAAAREHARAERRGGSGQALLATRLQPQARLRPGGSRRAVARG